MTDNNKNKNKGISKFLAGKTFYLVLAACLIAVGVAAWSAVASINNYVATPSEPEYTEDINSYTDNNEVSIPEAPVQNTVSDEPYESERSEPSDTTSAQPVASGFIMPVKSGKVQKNYDDTTLQYSATFNDLRIHLGIDITAETGSEVLASGDGTVTKIYSDALLGKIIEIDHGNGITLKYCGLSDTAVSEGDYVTIGDKIATLGSVPGESADTPHLHLEAYKNGKIASPLKALNLE